VQSNFVTRPAFNLIQAANFSKYISNARKKRLPMTTKRAGKGFYKGNGCRKEGVISSKGKNIVKFSLYSHSNFVLLGSFRYVS